MTTNFCKNTALIRHDAQTVTKILLILHAVMKIIRTKYIPVRGFSAINLLGILFVHPGVYLSQELINHERIHTAQLLEMAIVGFYVWYVVEWLVRLCRRGNAYRQISFEREAYEHQRDLNYLNHRRHYAWRHYL